MASDPYRVLGVSPNASDEELRHAYRQMVKLHHPDHNGGSEESEQRFEDVQEAYSQILAMRKHRPSQTPPHRRSPDPRVDARIAEMERQLRDARRAREQALRDAREAASLADDRRPTDEELGYVDTDDSFSRILADALDDIAARLKGRP